MKKSWHFWKFLKLLLIGFDNSFVAEYANIIFCCCLFVVSFLTLNRSCPHIWHQTSMNIFDRLELFIWLCFMFFAPMEINVYLVYYKDDLLNWQISCAYKHRIVICSFLNTTFYSECCYWGRKLKNCLEGGRCRVICIAWTIVTDNAVLMTWQKWK